MFSWISAEQEILLEQLELPEDISIVEVIKILENVEVIDKEPLARSFNEEIINSTIKSLKNMV